MLAQIGRKFKDGLMNIFNPNVNKRNPLYQNRVITKRLSYQDLRELSKDGIASKIVRIKVGNALNNTMVFTSDEDQDFYEGYVRAPLHKAISNMLIFGRAIVIINEMDEDLSQPLSEGGPVNWKLDVFGGDMVGVIDIDLNFQSNRFYKPTYYTVRGMRLHYSRVIDFRYAEPPFEELPEYLFGGISELQRCHEAIKNDLIVTRASTALLEKSSLLVHKMEGYSQAMNLNQEDFIRAKIAETEDARSIYGALVIDAKDDCQILSQNLPNLDDSDKFSLRRIALVTDIPVSELTGEEVQGLNATGDNQRHSFRRMIQVLQNDYIKPGLDLLMMKLGRDVIKFSMDQNIDPGEKAQYDASIIDNASKLEAMGQDGGMYLVEKGIVKEEDIKEGGSPELLSAFGSDDDGDSDQEVM